TFFVRLLPYLEEQSLYDKWDFTTPANNVTADASTSRAATKIPVLICPSDQFESNPFSLPGGPAAFPSTSSPGAVDGMYSGTSYAGNYGEGSYYTQFSQFGIKPDGVFFVTGLDTSLKMPGGGLHASCDNHYNLPPVKMQTVTD